jgi:hypothetical protein
MRDGLPARSAGQVTRAGAHSWFSSLVAENSAASEGDGGGACRSVGDLQVVHRYDVDNWAKAEPKAAAMGSTTLAWIKASES